MTELSTAREVKELLDDVRTAMITTPDERGTLSSRPVTIQQITDDGDIWFLVDANADWVRPASTGPINATVIDDDDAWVSFAGRAELDSSPARIDELTDAMSETFFGDGAEPIALRFVTDRIEWWTAAGALKQIFEIASAKLLGGEPDIGSSGTIDI